MAALYTIGHSTRDLAEFSAVLQQHGIDVLADIRAFPISKRHPHFNREALEMWCPEIGLEYRWVKELGGRRGKGNQPSPHTALREESFRNYADHMLTAEFQTAAGALAELGAARRVAYMCAEKLYFQCHRMMVSDYFVSRGHEVLHILDMKPAKPHTLMREARILAGRLIYSGEMLF